MLELTNGFSFELFTEEGISAIYQTTLQFLVSIRELLKRKIFKFFSIAVFLKNSSSNIKFLTEVLRDLYNI